MAKFIRHDYGAIHEALNKMIVAEVKAALELLPDKAFETDGRVPLCRVVASGGFDYCPRDLSVKRVWLNDDNELCFSEYTAEEDEGDVYTWTEDDDLLDITDFAYLIDQIAEQVKDGYDDNLYSNVGVFTDESEARKAFDRECQTALADAKYEDGCTDHEGTYDVNEEKSDIEYSVSRSGSTYYTTVKLKEQEIETTPETKMVIGEYLYNNIAYCLTNLSNEADACRKQRIIRHILHSLRENCITED